MPVVISRFRGHGGFSLIELLIVMLLLGIVGAIAATGISRGLQADREAQSRVEAFEDIQIAMERVSRDIRASARLIDIGPDDIRFQLFRDGSCIEYRYRVDANNNLIAAEAESTDGCNTLPAPTERILVPGIEPDSTVFSYETDRYLTDGVDFVEDGDGNLQRVPAASADEAKFVTITFRRTLVDETSVTVRTVVGLRNVR